MILIDGVKYKLWVPENEKQLEEMVKEHFNDIFGENSLYFDIKPELRSKAGIGSKPDGIAIVFDKPCFYVVEIERAEHGVHDHVVTQISKFNTALKKSPGTRMKIAEAIYSEITSDPFKQFFAKSKVKGELYKFLTDLFLYKKPIIIAIIIDEAIDELKEAIEELPLQSKIVEFKTFERVGVGLGIHAHLFEPIIEKVQLNSEEEVTGRVKKGEILPQAEYTLPILESLVEMGGSGRMPKVLDKVYDKMKDRLRKKDLEMLSSGTAVRWKNRAQWERQRLKSEGYLKKDSPRGTWEITDEGRKLYERLKQRK